MSRAKLFSRKATAEAKARRKRRLLRKASPAPLGLEKKPQSNRRSNNLQSRGSNLAAESSLN
jgi:hypothetical protein